MSASPILEQIRNVLRIESRALLAVADRVDARFEDAVHLLRAATGKVILTGVGKSGLVARKIAATMSSTGTPAVFLHPTDAMHGDLGLVGAGDVVLAFGKSGESDELTALLPAFRRVGAKVIAVTSKAESSLGRAADLAVETGPIEEACPNQLVPTSSTTVALAIGDAFALTLMHLKNFRVEDFALRHPGGALGRRLLLRVADLMIPRARCPVLDPAKTTIEEVISALGSYGLGVVLFSRDGSQLHGILTDGDLRRALSQHRAKIFDLPLATFINAQPVGVASETLAAEALQFMEARERPLNVVPVLDGDRLAGVLRIHELVKLG